eukprot:623625-Prymnesium_polylepis.1
MLIAVWPIGVPIVYAVLLWASKDALMTNRPTPLSHAIGFLSNDYQAVGKGCIWWEPLEMMRKLALTGWVLLIEEDAVQARVLVALVVSVVFLTLQLTIKPLKRCVLSERLATLIRILFVHQF